MKPIVSLCGKSGMVRSLRLAALIYILTIHCVCLAQSPTRTSVPTPEVVDDTAARVGGDCFGLPNDTSYLLLQAAEQNKDPVITEIDELLSDNFRAYNETYGGLHTFWGDDIISNLIGNICQLAYKWSWTFINQNINILLPISSCAFVLLFLQKTRCGGTKGSSITRLGLFLAISIFLVGLELGPFFVAPELELSNTGLWLARTVVSFCSFRFPS